MDRPEDLEYQPPPHRVLTAVSPSWFVAPPYGWRHPVTGRYGWQPDPLLLAFGQYVKRGRYFARQTQVQLSKLSGVEQGTISRLERALAPATQVDRLVHLGDALGRALPLGYCPHEHYCPWQPAPKAPAEEPFDRLPESLRELFNVPTDPDQSE